MERKVIFLFLIPEVVKGETDSRTSVKYFFFPASFYLHSRRFQKPYLDVSVHLYLSSVTLGSHR